jgi:hypothetical protein
MMSVNGIIESGAGAKIVESERKPGAERSEGGAAFNEILQQELQQQKASGETASERTQPLPGFATFPVYELSELDSLPVGGDLRERGIRDTEQLIDILDNYRQELDRGRLDPARMKETVQVLDQVSRDMMEYINQVDHQELSDLMQESLVMARVEVEKYSRGDYNS